ncbi:fatty acid desaturase [Algiphilus sp.]|uniref:fatty acid desaturase n=1 Tax=Algiphilus sp. TaxID=1872431 RepID=UPI0025C20B90|nr:fatty acid desaturase [Algiphilus sp.]MCK5769947.1 fatty acid desaturase [Algiphilus sp.]
MKPEDIRRHLDPAQRRELARLSRVRGVAVPTLMLAVAVVVGTVTVDALALTGALPLWGGALLNSLLGYFAFSVAHDAIHRAVSDRPAINDAIGQITVLTIAPYVHLGLFRWGHVQHHRFAVGPDDPDRVFRGPWWQLPFRWAFIDVAYLLYVTRHGDHRARRFLGRSLWMAGAFAVVVALLVAAGHGMAVLMLWFVPSRLIQMMLGFSFFWLPHAPHDVAQADHFTRASTIREGHEWLMDTLLQYQNYHLLHHLFPTMPFYNNGRAWRLLEPVLRRHELAIQEGFAIRPRIVRPAQGPLDG